MKNFFIMAVVLFAVGGLFYAFGGQASRQASAIDTADYVRRSGLTYEQSQSTVNLGVAQESIDSGGAKKIESMGNLLISVAILILLVGIVLVALMLALKAAADNALYKALGGN